MKDRLAKIKQSNGRNADLGGCESFGLVHKPQVRVPRFYIDQYGLDILSVNNPFRSTKNETKRFQGLSRLKRGGYGGRFSERDQAYFVSAGSPKVWTNWQITDSHSKPAEGAQKQQSGRQSQIAALIA